MDEAGVGQQGRDFFEQLEAKIKVLNAVAWEGRCDWPTVNDWLQQFAGASGMEENEERLQMLFLLSNFIYFAVVRRGNCSEHCTAMSFATVSSQS